VPLEEEMPAPGQPVSARDRGQQPGWVAGGDEHDEAHERERSSHEMQTARGAVAVLIQVVRIERGEARKSLGFRSNGIAGPRLEPSALEGACVSALSFYRAPACATAADGLRRPGRDGLRPGCAGATRTRSWDD